MSCATYTAVFGNSSHFSSHFTVWGTCNIRWVISTGMGRRVLLLSLFISIGLGLRDLPCLFVFRRASPLRSRHAAYLDGGRPGGSAPARHQQWQARYL